MIGNPRKNLPQEWVLLYDYFRFEITSFVGRLFQPRVLRFSNFDYLNLGCGIIPERIPQGFFNVEHFLFKKEPWVDACVDLRFPLPFPDGAWKGIFMHHVFEHLTYKHACQLLRECYRVLKEGGVLRIVVPDAEKIIRLYCDDSSPELSDLMIHFYRGKFKTKMEVVNEIFHSATVQQAHHFGWDFETMKFRIQEAGFNRCEKMSAGVSIDKKLQIDHLPWEPVSLYVDAVK